MIYGFIYGGVMVCVERGRTLTYNAGILRNGISVVVSFVLLHSDRYAGCHKILVDGSFEGASTWC